MTGPRSLPQLALLLGLWWRHMRRRAARLGEAPKQSGAPTFLLLNLMVAGYMATLVWAAVVRTVGKDHALVGWHLLGVLVIGLGSGISKGAGGVRLRGTRNDAFLEPLPLTLLARLGLQLADTIFILPLVVTVPVAAAIALGLSGLAVVGPGALALLLFATMYFVGQALVTWARVLGPASVARLGGYLGIGLYITGMAATFSPVGSFLGAGGPWLATLQSAWLEGGVARAGLVGGALGIGGIAYAALALAERANFDRLPPASAAPKASKQARDRNALEWQMMLRQGGRPLLFAFVALLGGLVWAIGARGEGLNASRLGFLAGFVVYLGALQTIAQAGRAARSDLAARPFLAALPLSPHEVLDGKAQALRRLLLPVLLMLAAIGGLAAWRAEPGLAYRMGLAMLALYIAADGAVSVAFLSSGIGVVGVGGGQASSGFSTQLLMMPLLATVVAPTEWAATTAFIAAGAVTWEARRAAQRSVRWIDDPADDTERETTVWRALLAATAFFALQAMSVQLLSVFEIPSGYLLAIAFVLSAGVLGLLTWRNGARFARPRFFPRHVWLLPVGVIAGLASGALALGMARLIPARGGEAMPAFSSGELIALAVTMTIVAPLFEEYFFRGWLQKAIEQDLPASLKRWAFALGAVAFALAHLGSYGVPQLVLGLLAGGLYAAGGGLWPAILAHAVHNGFVLLMAQRAP